MKVAPLLLLVFGLIPLSDRTAAQQYYNFEDACRMAGRSTGACALSSRQQSPLGCVSITGNAFHADKSLRSSCIETTLSPAIDTEICVEMIGLPNISKVNDLKLTIGRSVGFQNAVALFHNGSRMIILDPEWAKSATAEAYLVLGHEAGHHFCGHVLDSDPLARKKQELEADQFSGAAIKRFEAYHDRAFLQGALQAATRLYSPSESGSHPSREARLEAIVLGYNSGSSCATLAPGVRGYTAGPR
jgi:hypothetical protein